jgi:hypothetical protein
MRKGIFMNIAGAGKTLFARLALVACVTGAVGFSFSGSRAVADPVELDGLSMVYVDVGGGSAQKVPNIVCQQSANCAVVVINANGLIQGCSSSCAGTCNFCIAPGVASSFCVPKENSECNFGGQGTFTCGNRREGTCTTAGNNPRRDANGCWCATSPGRLTSRSCTLQHCL